MRTLSVWIAAVLLVLGLNGGSIAAPSYERIMIAGDSPLHGYGDPSLEYDENGVGWMSYSAVREGMQINTCLAKSADAGKTWTHVMTINDAEKGSISGPLGPISGIWQNEVSSVFLRIGRQAGQP